MAAVKLLQFCENLSTRKWSDTDLVEDIDYLKAELENNFHTLTYVEYSCNMESAVAWNCNEATY
jgi:V-type H+-transporting ATPase subunit H